MIYEIVSVTNDHGLLLTVALRSIGTPDAPWFEVKTPGGMLYGGESREEALETAFNCSNEATPP